MTEDQQAADRLARAAEDHALRLMFEFMGPDPAIGSGMDEIAALIRSPESLQALAIMSLCGLAGQVIDLLAQERGTSAWAVLQELSQALTYARLNGPEEQSHTA